MAAGAAPPYPTTIRRGRGGQRTHRQGQPSHVCSLWPPARGDAEVLRASAIRRAGLSRDLDPGFARGHKEAPSCTARCWHSGGAGRGRRWRRTRYDRVRRRRPPTARPAGRPAATRPGPCPCCVPVPVRLSRRRRAAGPPEFHNVTSSSSRNPPVHEYCTDLLKNLKIRGPVAL
jgi:hypothetical protein